MVTYYYGLLFCLFVIYVDISFDELRAVELKCLQVLLRIVERRRCDCAHTSTVYVLRFHYVLPYYSDFGFWFANNGFILIITYEKWVFILIYKNKKIIVKIRTIHLDKYIVIVFFFSHGRSSMHLRNLNQLLLSRVDKMNRSSPWFIKSKICYCNTKNFVYLR